MNRNGDPLAVGVLVLVTTALVGMVVGRWEVVLYPSLLLVGVLLGMALPGLAMSVRLGVAVGTTALLLVLFAVLHAMGIADPSGEGLVLGMDPMTILYLFGVGAAFLLVNLLFALFGADRTADGTSQDDTTGEEFAR
jgi:hypothetical protein